MGKRRFPEKNRIKRELRKRQHGRCAICEEKSKRLEMHHIKPRSMGGPDKEENLILLCPACHKDVHDMIKQLKLNKESEFFRFKQVIRLLRYYRQEDRHKVKEAFKQIRQPALEKRSVSKA